MNHKNSESTHRGDTGDLVPFLGVRRKWVGIALYLFSMSMGVYAFFPIRYYLAKGWKGYETVRTITSDMTDFIPLGIAILIILFVGVDWIMIFYRIVKDHFEARNKKRLAEAEARGEARGMQVERQEWVDWDARRAAAAAAGDPFHEPSPAEKRAIRERDPADET